MQIYTEVGPVVCLSMSEVHVAFVGTISSVFPAVAQAPLTLPASFKLNMLISSFVLKIIN